MNVIIGKLLGFIIGDDTKRRTLDSKLKQCESPMEQRFLLAADPVLSQFGAIIPQYIIAGYRVDFAIPDVMMVIEIDGHDWHSSKEQIRSDLQRQRDITRHGWCVVRFSGSEVYADAAGCANEAAQIIHKNS